MVLLVSPSGIRYGTFYPGLGSTDGLSPKDSRNMLEDIKDKYTIVMLELPERYENLTDQSLEDTLKILELTKKNWIRSSSLGKHAHPDHEDTPPPTQYNTPRKSPLSPMG